MDRPPAVRLAHVAAAFALLLLAGAAEAVNESNITSWSNNVTNDAALSLTVDNNTTVRFNATANQSGNWTWRVDGTAEKSTTINATTDDFNFTFNNTTLPATRIVNASVTNSNGTSLNVSWTVTIAAPPGPPNITTWSNNYTNDSSLTVSVPNGTVIRFNGTANQSGNWTWRVDGLDEKNSTNATTDTFDRAFSSVSLPATFVVNATVNNTNGTSSNLSWTVKLNSPPNITSWQNNYTSNDTLAFTVDLDVGIRFNATSNQTANWTWKRDGVSDQTNASNATAYYNTSFSTSGSHNVSVAVNNSNGTSTTLLWSITVSPGGPPPDPYLVWGYLRNETGGAVTSHQVNLNDSNTSCALNVTTASDGSFAFDLSDCGSGGYYRNDTLVVNATNSTQGSYGETTVNVSNNTSVWDTHANLSIRPEPLWRSQGSNVTTLRKPLDQVLLFAQAVDGRNLTNATLATNETGAWTNWTGGTYNSPVTFALPNSAVWNWSNFTWQNNSVAEGTTVGWRVYYRDADNRLNATDVLTFLLLGPAPNVTSWSNNKTNNNTLAVALNTSEAVRFNATNNQSGNWTWREDGAIVNQTNGTNESNYSTAFSSGASHTVNVSFENVNGTGAVNWSATVDLPPASVTSLTAAVIGSTYVNWTWTNPTDSDFNCTNVWVNDSFQSCVAGAAGTLSYFNYTNFTANVSQNISTITQDLNVNKNATNYTNTTFTLADTPGAPTVKAVANSSINVVVDPATNPAATEFAINVAGSATGWVQSGGDVGPVEAWRTYSTWGGASGFNATGLLTNASYTFSVKARNGNYTETNLSSSASNYTLADQPTSLTVVSANNSSLTLTWSNNTNTNGTFIDVFRDNVLIASVTGTSYIDLGRSTNASHTYIVGARSGNGERNNSTAASNFTLADQPTGLAVVSANNSSLTLTWSNNTNTNGTFIDVFRDNVLIASVTGTSYIDLGRSTNASHTYIVGARNANGFRNNSTSASNFTLADQPTGLAVVSANNSSLTLTWSNNTNTNGTFIDVFRDNVLIASVTGTSYIDLGRSTNASHTYIVGARSGNGERNNSTAASNFTLADQPTGLAVVAAASNAISLTWNNATNPSGTFIDVFRDSVLIASVSASSYTDSGLAPNTSYAYVVGARSGNSERNNSTSVSNYTYAAQPSGVTVVSSNNSSLTVSWSNASNPLGTLFDVFRDNVLINTTYGDAFSFIDLGRSTNASHTYIVGARDANSIRNNSTAVLNYTLADQPTGLQVSTLNLSAISLSWANATNPSGTFIDIFRNGVLVANVSGTSYTDTGLTSNTSYTYVVGARDGSGQRNNSTSAVNYTLAEQPTILTAAGVQMDRINLTWDNAGNPVGTVVGVYRDAVLVANVTSTGSSDSYSDGGLSPNTSHSYIVGAVNGNGLRNNSTAVTAFSLGDQPTGLAAVALSNFSISLSWANATNPSGTFIDIFRNGVLVANVSGTSYTDTGLTSNTSYTYVVGARDGSGQRNNSTSASNYTLADQPTGLAVASANNSSLTLTWSTNANPSGTFYDVFRDSVLVATVLDAASYVDLGRSTNTSHTYVVGARSGNGERNNSTSASNYTLADQPTGLAVVALNTSANNLTWSNATNPSGTLIGVFRNSVLVASVSDTTYIDRDLSPNTTYTYVVGALNGQGQRNNSSAVSNTTDAAQPSGLAVSSPNNSSLVLSWSNASNPTGTFFDVFRDNVLVNTATTASFVDLGRSTNASHTYIVGARNANGFRNNSTSASNFTLADQPTGLAVVSANNSSLTLTWSNNTNTNGTFIDVFRDSVLIASVSGTSYVDLGRSTNTSYAYVVGARSGNGERNNSTSVSNYTNAAQPASLQVSASGNASFIISWSNADNPPGTEIDVYRDNALVNTTTGTTVNDTGLSTNVSYTYIVGARNGLSIRNNSTSVSNYTFSTTPVGLAAVALNNTTINVSWEANSNPGGTFYELFNESGLLTSTTGLYYLHSGLTDNNTSTYWVRSSNGKGYYTINSTNVSNMTPDQRPPTFVSITPSTNYTFVNASENVTFSSDWSDGGRLGSYTFTWNGTGAYCDNASTSPSNTSFWNQTGATAVNVSPIPQQCLGRDIGFFFTVTDAAGNSIDSPIRVVRVRNYDASVALNNTTVVGEYRDTLVLDVTVRNTGNVDDRYEVRCSGGGSGNATLNNTSNTASCGSQALLTGTLAPQGFQNLTLVVNAIKPGSFLVSVNASSTNKSFSRTGSATFVFKPAVKVVADTTLQATENNSSNPAAFDATFNLTITNTGTRARTYVLGNSTPVPPAGLNLSFNNTTAFTSTTATVSPGGTVNHLVVANSTNVTTYRTTIFVNASDDANKNASFTLTLVVSDVGVYNVSIALDANVKTGEINDDVYYNVTVKNAGNRVDSYTVKVVNSSEVAELTGLNNSTFLANLNPGETRTGNLRVRNSAPGTYADLLSVSNNTSGGASNVTAALTTVTSGVLVTASPLAQTVNTGTFANYTVTVANTGSRDHTYNLTNVSAVATPETNVVHPANVTVPKGESRDITLAVQSPTQGLFATTLKAEAQDDFRKNGSVTVLTLATQTTVCGLRLAVSLPNDDGLLDFEQHAVDKGDNGTFLLSVENLGNAPDVVQLSVTRNQRGAQVFLDGLRVANATDSSGVLNKSLAPSSFDVAVLQVLGYFGAYPVRVTARSMECNTTLQADVRTVTVIKELTNSTVSNSFVSEDAAINGSNVSNASIGSLLLDSSVTDSIISGALLNNSTITDGSVLRDVEVEDATIDNNVISRGTIAIGNLTFAFEGTNATNIDRIVNASETNKSLGGLADDDVALNSSSAQANVTLSLGSGVPAASGTLTRTAFRPVGVADWVPSDGRRLGDYVDVDVDPALRNAMSGNARVRIYFNESFSDLDGSSLVVRRYVEGSGWQNLTSCTRQTSTSPYYVECDTPGFSVFSIAGSFPAQSPTPTPAPQSSGGGGGGGGGAAEPEAKAKVLEQESQDVALKAGQVSTARFSSTDVAAVSLKARQDGAARVTAKKLADLPRDVPAPLATTYGFAEITTDNPDLIDEARVQVRVKQSWVDSFSVDQRKIKLERFADGRWTALSTTVAGRDGEFLLLESEPTKGFSYFTITAEKQAALRLPSLTAVIAEAQRQFVSFLGAGAEKLVEFFRTDVLQISMKVKTAIANIVLEVQKLAGRPAEVDAAPDLPYGYFTVRTMNIEEQDLVSAAIRFKVERSWLEQRGAPLSSVVLNRYNGTRWVPLPTEKVQELDGNVVFEGKTPGFSIFALAGDTEPARVSLFAITVTGAPAATPPPSTPTPAPAPSFPIASVLGLGGLVAAVVVVIALAGLAKKRKK